MGEFNYKKWVTDYKNGKPLFEQATGSNTGSNTGNYPGSYTGSNTGSNTGMYGSNTGSACYACPYQYNYSGTGMQYGVDGQWYCAGSVCVDQAGAPFESNPLQVNDSTMDPSTGFCGSTGGGAPGQPSSYSFDYYVHPSLLNCGGGTTPPPGSAAGSATGSYTGSYTGSNTGSATGNSNTGSSNTGSVALRRDPRRDPRREPRRRK